MREILFKAKRKDNGKWVEGYLYGIWEQRYICCGMTNDVPNMTEVIPETVSQYTGLTDKNGNKIWENDIVTIPREDELFVIRWDIEQAAFVIESDMLLCDFDNYYGKDLEVIGNVFDNADFLKESEE